MTRRPLPTRERGFTLLEILLALVLLAFVMVGVWGAISGATRITRSANVLMEQGDQVQATRRFLRTWLAAAVPQPFIEAGAARARMFQGSPHSMQFVAPLPVQAGHAGLYLQTLSWVDDGHGGSTLELAYVPYRGYQEADARPERHALLTGLRGGSFHYLAAAAFNQPAGWRDDWTASAGLPLAVRIEFETGAATRITLPAMIIPLHAGDGIGLQAGAQAP